MAKQSLGNLYDVLDSAIAAYFEDHPMFSYLHDQPFASDDWTIVHNLGYFPSVTVVDTAGTNVEGIIEYVDVNSLHITFSGAFSGQAYLS